jgi:nitrogen regulatory protein P-II 1
MVWKHIVDSKFLEINRGGKIMKLIIAYIQPEKLNEVKQELFKNDIKKMSVTTSLGCGQQGGYTEIYRGAISEVNLLEKTRIEIAVNDNYVDKTLKAIVKSAKSGNIGDGKIFILEIAQCIRIRTEETGPEAIG